MLVPVVLVSYLVAVACSKPPIERLGLIGTSWTVTAIGGTTVPLGELTISITGDLDGGGAWATVVRTSCRTVASGVSWDSSSDAISFGVVGERSSPCATDLARDDDALFAALESVDHWSIQSANEITLYGSTELHLRMLSTPGSPTAGRRGKLP